jgi:methionyl-tRNA formyltransferase
VPIGARDTSASLHEVLGRLGARAVLEVLDALAAQRLRAQPQPAAGVSYAHKIAKSEAPIRWSESAAVISRQVRAFIPWPVAETIFDGEPLRIHGAYAPPEDAVPAAAGAPGTWLGLSEDAQALRVACGRGELHVTAVQRAGRKVVAAREFVNAAGSAGGKFG